MLITDGTTGKVRARDGNEERVIAVEEVPYFPPYRIHL